MECGSSDVAALLLATELKGNAESSESLPPGLTKAAARDGAAVSFPGRRRATKTQVESLLEDQRRFALRDGAAVPQPFSSCRGVSTVNRGVGGGALSHLPDMFGQGTQPATALTAPTPMGAALSTSAVVTALQDAVLCWSASSSSPAARGGAVGTRHDGVGDGDAILAPHVRRSWRLIEATHRSVVRSASSPPASWSVGQRWVRVDHVAQVNALAHAVWGESVMQRARAQSDTDGSYPTGLRMCYDSTHSTASFAAFVSAASSDVLVRTEAQETCEESSACGRGCSSPSLAFFTFTEREYDAIVPPSMRFTYASSCYLVQLWARFGNPVVAVDRWRWSESGGEEGHGKGEQWVPTVEEACAEYHRVTVGVLQLRRQQLLDVIQLQQQCPVGESSAAPSPAAHATRGGRKRGTGVTVDEGSSAVAECTSMTAALRQVPPFVASFDRYALLQHTAAAVLTDDPSAAPAPLRQVCSSGTLKEGEPSMSLLPSQPSPPPIPPSSDGSSATLAATVSGDSGALALDVPLAPPLAGPTVTAQERLTAQVTPNPWFAHDAEVHRRSYLAQLLRQEQQMNVPYQLAANRYLALAASTALALQRAVFAFYSRDEEADLAEAPARKNEVDTRGSTDRAALRETTLPPGSSSLALHPPGRPPRSTFTVQLQPLPSVDPAAWRTAEVTVRKAAAEVLGTVNLASPAAGVASPSRHPSRRAATAVGSQKRARSATTAHVATSGRRRGRVAVTKSVAEGVAADVLAQRKGNGDSDNEVASSEVPAPSETDSEFSNDEQDHEGSVAGEDADESVKIELMGEQRQRHPTRSSPTSSSSRLRLSVDTGTAHSQASHLPADATYAALQTYITDVLPFRCARLRGVVQAGWLLPAPPALPHTLTDPVEEEEVGVIDAQTRGNTTAENGPTFAFPLSSSSPQPEQGPVTGNTAAVAHSLNSALLAPILTEEEYQQLRKVNAASVCNRVVSHTDEAVLLSLPSTVSRLHREVEQELERYLYEDTSALMEVNPVAQSLVGAIRVAYTQNKLLHRIAARLEHVLDGLKKVSEECEEEAQAVSRRP